MDGQGPQDHISICALQYLHFFHRRPNRLRRGDDSEAVHAFASSSPEDPDELLESSESESEDGSMVSNGSAAMRRELVL